MRSVHFEEAKTIGEPPTSKIAPVASGKTSSRSELTVIVAADAVALNNAKALTAAPNASALVTRLAPENDDVNPAARLTNSCPIETPEIFDLSPTDK
ncbi:MAG: hypothetical protein EAZ43_04365 [Betaproteobacteria bacterium]|nr:MAG: hypothetical protein EAZ43_04365 [Betaproteobacteria bacterium]